MSDSCIEIVRGDITALGVEVVVTAANAELAGGGGVDGAVHRAAGPELLEACRRIEGGCPTGRAVLTEGFALAPWVIHAVGPIWGREGGDEEALLASAYRETFALVARTEARSVALPAISCGVYGFPVERAAAIAVAEARRFVAGRETPPRILLCCFDAGAEACYRAALGGGAGTD